MRILIDEDLASRELIHRLEVVLPGDVLLAPAGSSDAVVWERAQSERAAVLSGNVTDFLAIAVAAPAHHGLLLVYRQNDVARDLRAIDIVAAIIEIRALYPTGISDTVLAVNSFSNRRG